MVAPKQVNKFKESYHDLPKNDYRNSFVIADCLRFVRINKKVYIRDHRYKVLQSLTMARSFVVRKAVGVLFSSNKLVDGIFLCETYSALSQSSIHPLTKGTVTPSVWCNNSL